MKYIFLKPSNYPPWVSTLLAFGIAQLLLAIGGLIRVPLIISSLGAEVFAQVVIATGICSFTVGVADGITQAARSNFLQDSSPSANVSMSGYLKFAAIAFSLINLALLFILSAVEIFGLTYMKSTYPIVYGLIGSSVALLGSPFRGYMEATGKTAISALLQATTTLIGLPLLFLSASLLESPILVYIVTGFGMALPYLVTISKRNTPASTSISKLFIKSSGLNAPLAIATLQMIRWSLSTKIGNSFDAVAISIFVGYQAAASYGLTSRIMTFAMITSLALTPLTNVMVSNYKNTLRGPELRKALSKMTLALVASASIFSTIALAIFPWIFDVTSENKLSPDNTLNFAFVAFALLSSLSLPLLSLFNDVEGNVFRSRLSLIFGLINIPLSFLLAYWLGIAGATISSCLTLSALSTCLLFTKRFRAVFWD